MIDSDHMDRRVDGTAVIDGVEVPASTVQLDYELNGVPRATVVVPTGRDAGTGLASPAAALLSDQALRPIEVMVRCEYADADGSEFGVPHGEWVKVFEGRTGGFGAVRRRNPPQAGLRVSANHWLDEADHSSIFSRWSHPSNPAQYSAAMIHRAGGTGIAASPSYWGPYDSSDAIRESNVRDDLWGKALRPFFEGLARADGLAVPEQGLGGSGLPNDAALAILSRIRAPEPLKLRISADAQLDTAIREHLQAVLSDPGELAARTLWDVLVGGLAGSYLFAVVPRVEDALVVPFAGACRRPFADLGLDQLDAVDLAGRSPRPVRAVGVLGRYDATTGLDGRPSADGRSALAVVGGWREVPGPGTVHIEQPPPWAASCLAATRYAASSSGAFGARIATADRPEAADPDAGAEAARGDGAEASRGVLERLATARMAQLRSVDRQGSAGGPLRLDLAPGSTVRLAVSGDPAAGGVDGWFVAAVLRASSVLSAEGRAARTSFHLGFLRTEAENAVDAWALDEHPLYDSLFSGAPLRG